MADRPELNRRCHHYIAAAAVAAAGALAVQAVAGAGPREPAHWSLPEGAVRAAVAQRATLYGIPADIVYYEAPLGVPGMIAHLEAHHPALRDLAVLPGMAVLSDRSGACLRTATVAGVGLERSAGTLSQVCWPETAPAATAAPAWMPAGAQLAFDFGVQDAPAAYSQQIWRHGGAPDDVRAELRRALVRHGWTPLPPGSSPGEPAREWRRGAQLLAIDTVAAGPGSAVVLRLQHPPADGAGPVPESAP